MKIEKLTENKIRILLNNEEIKSRNMNNDAVFSKNVESQLLFLEILESAKKQVGFNTDGYKLLIEGFSSADSNLVVTITRFLDKTAFPVNSSIKNKNKKVKVCKKPISFISSNCTYIFDSFESFCDLCNRINFSSLSTKGFAKQVSLYLLNNNYYLVLKNVNKNHKDCKKIISLILEFGKYVNSSLAFESKLLEHGKIIINKNAIGIGIKHFCN